MELDLDSLVAAVGSDSDSDDEAAPYRRTVDEILEEDSDSSSSAASATVQSNGARLKLPNVERSSLPRSISEAVAEEPSGSSLRRPERELYSTTSLPSLARRSHPTPRPLPPLFGSIRQNPKPGAALAAAAAASRSVPTPHAAAIKFRRASGASSLEFKLAEVPKTVVGGEGSGGITRRSLLDVNLADVEPDQLVGSPMPSSPSSSILEAEQVSEESVHSVDDTDQDTDMLATLDDGLRTIEDIDPIDDSEVTREELVNSISSTSILEMKDKGSIAIPESFSVDAPNIDDAPAHDSFPSDGRPQQVEPKENSQLLSNEPEDGDLDDSGSAPAADFGLETNSGRENAVPDTVESKSDGTKKASRKADKRLRASMKPLEWAEELEKRQASSGFHLEEGAAAQPMKLEGISKGPPAVGYLQTNAENAITRAISSQGFRLAQGIAQALAVHMNFIAIGTSKGIVVVVASKYSAHAVDSMDSKMLVLGAQGEKTLSPVTSMCFSQHADLLLVGYSDGHIIVWDMQKAAAVKLITGEHKAPVVHTLFLGQDSQITRQFKAVTGDSEGSVRLHTFSVVPLLNRFSVKSQPLFNANGKIEETVLSISPLLADYSQASGLLSAQGNPNSSSSGLGSMVGGVVGGVVGGEAGWKLFNEGNPALEEGVVIIVTHQQAIVGRLGPTFEHYETISRPEGVRQGSIPYTAWKNAQFLRASSKDSPESISWLAIAWDRKIQVHKLVKTQLEKYKEWALDCPAIGVAWLSDQMFIVLGAKGQLCLFSRDEGEFYRTSFVADGSDGESTVSYHIHFVNSFRNPEKAFHNSVAVRGATVYILGSMNLIVSRLLPWKERIQVLQKAGDWMGALDMSMRIYDGHAHGVIDLPKAIESIRNIIMPYLVELLFSYVDEVFSYISVACCNQSGENKHPDAQDDKGKSVRAETEEQFARVGCVAVEYCLHIKRMDILFDDIFSKFVAVKHGGTFLEILEPYILKDMLGSLPPEIMQALVEHYSGKGWLQRVEQCVLHMDISSLDFNQVIKLCRVHGLYGALIYLFNQGLNDYKTPLEELLAAIQNLTRADATAIGYRMLVYLKYCFLGLAFPPGHGNISFSCQHSLRKELLQFLLEDSSASDSYVIKSIKASCGSCPNLCYLLWLDVEATLEVVRCALLDDRLSTSESLVDTDDLVPDEKKTDSNNSEKNYMAQRVVNTIVKCFDMESDELRYHEIGDNISTEIWPSEKDTCLLNEFIASFVACGQVTITGKVLNHILKYLTSAGISSGTAQKADPQRERLIISLMDVVSEKDWNTSYVLDLCVTAHFYQACALIYTARSQYFEALDSYMKDVDEPAYAFAFINTMLAGLKQTDYLSFRSTTMSCLHKLVKLSREGAFFLVLDHFNEESQHVLSELQNYSESLFLFLKTVVEIHMKGKLEFSLLERSRASTAYFGKKIRIYNDLGAYLDRLSSLPQFLQHNPFCVTDELAELYLELLCQYESGSVLKFLETFESYRLEYCLRLCLDYKIMDAASFLLERAGDVTGALALTMNGVDEKLKVLSSSVQKALSASTLKGGNDLEFLDSILKIDEAMAVNNVLQACIGLCQRNTQRLDPQESESLWFRLLDVFCSPLRGTDHHKLVSGGSQMVPAVDTYNLLDRILRRVFSHFIREIVDGMVGYIPLPIIMAKLLSDNGNQEFGDFKLTILGMLGTYGFERRILDTAKSLIEDDTFYTMNLLKKGASHAYSPQSLLCSLCGCQLTKGSLVSGIRIYGCGHATHLHCESLENEQSGKSNLTGCCICTPKSKTSRHRNKMALVEKGLVKKTSSKGQSKKGTNSTHHLHDPEPIEKPYGPQQPTRFEILSNLQKGQKLLQVDSIPQLRLAPPAIYHEKVQKGVYGLMGENAQLSTKNEKSNKSQHAGQKSRFPKRFPLKSSIFGSEKARLRIG